MLQNQPNETEAAEWFLDEYVNIYIVRFPLSNEVNTTKSDSSVKVYIMTEQASTSKEKADEIVEKRGKTNSVVWKWFGFLRSDKLLVSVLCKMCRRVVPTSSGNRGEMRLKHRHANGCGLRRLLAYHCQLTACPS